MLRVKQGTSIAFYYLERAEAHAAAYYWPKLHTEAVYWYLMSRPSGRNKKRKLFDRGSFVINR